MNRTLLCVANYRPNVGYAWDFIEGLYARVADRLVRDGVRTLVAYPADGEARALTGSAARAVCLDASLTSVTSARATAAFVRHENVGVVWFVDRAVRHWAYPCLRLAGARSIVVHDHSGGERTSSSGVRRVAKHAVAKVPGLTADVVIGVSDFVARRHREVGLVPARRVVRIFNGLTPPSDGGGGTHAILGIPEERPIVWCAGRATPGKGVAYLLRAFARLTRAWTDGPRPVLLYCGDGPQLPELQALHRSLGAPADIILAGYRPDAADLAADARVCVVPSVFSESFCLAVLEAMMRGRPVVATRVGAIPELVEHDVTGVLVAPGNEWELAEAMAALLRNRPRAELLGAEGGRVARRRFTLDTEIQELVDVIRRAFGLKRQPPLPVQPREERVVTSGFEVGEKVGVVGFEEHPRPGSGEFAPSGREG